MKILIIRFSSIGDIVLTFPVISAIKKQIENVEIHYFTKKENKNLLKGCLSIDKCYFFEKKIFETLRELRNENYSVIIDLHKNIRSNTVRNYLRVKTYNFPKLNIQKWLYVKLKWDFLSGTHVVDRYFKAVEKIGVSNEKKPLQFHIPDSVTLNLASYSLKSKEYKAIVLGAQFNTKKLPFEKLDLILKKTKGKLVLLGGSDEEKIGNQLVELNNKGNVVNLSGKLSIMESAFFLKHASTILTNDTGLMHIASSFNSKILVVWGSTTRKFGMHPYPSKSFETIDFQVQGLPCRPCSKIGFSKCPKRHFKCMNNQNIDAIVAEFNA